MDIKVYKKLNVNLEIVAIRLMIMNQLLLGVLKDYVDTKTVTIDEKLEITENKDK